MSGLSIDPALFHDSAVSAETAAFNARFSAQLEDVPPSHLVPPEVIRTARDEGKGIFPAHGPDDGSYWEQVPEGQRIRISPTDTARAIYFHIHGGGWTLGRPSHYDRLNQKIAAETSSIVVSAEYRLAPENRWPACLDDCLVALRHAARKWPDLPIVIGGESAGGHLSSTVLVALRDDPLLERIRGAVLNYGCFDLRKTASMANWGDQNLVLSTPTVDWFCRNLAPDAVQWSDPALSTILAPLDGMPAALFQIGTRDPLLDDTMTMAARWVAAGNHAELAVYPGGIHAFDNFDLAISHSFRERQAAFMNACLSD